MVTKRRDIVPCSSASVSTPGHASTVFFDVIPVAKRCNIVSCYSSYVAGHCDAVVVKRGYIVFRYRKSDSSRTNVSIMGSVFNVSNNSPEEVLGLGVTCCFYDGNMLVRL